MLPFSIRDYVYAAVIILLIAFGVYERFHLIAEGAQKEITALKLSSDKLTAAADARVALLTSQYAASTVAIKANHEDQITAIQADHASDAQRLREYDAYRRAHPPVPSAASGSGVATAGVGSDHSDESSVERLEQVALQLNVAGNTVRAALNACMADRDALVQK